MLNSDILIGLNDLSCSLSSDSVGAIGLAGRVEAAASEAARLPTIQLVEYNTNGIGNPSTRSHLLDEFGSDLQVVFFTLLPFEALLSQPALQLTVAHVGAVTLFMDALFLLELGLGSRFSSSSKLRDPMVLLAESHFDLHLVQDLVIATLARLSVVEAGQFLRGFCTQRILFAFAPAFGLRLGLGRLRGLGTGRLCCHKFFPGIPGSAVVRQQPRPFAARPFCIRTGVDNISPQAQRVYGQFVVAANGQASHQKRTIQLQERCQALLGGFDRVLVLEWQQAWLGLDGGGVGGDCFRSYEVEDFESSLFLSCDVIDDGLRPFPSEGIAP